MSRTTITTANRVLDSFRLHGDTGTRLIDFVENHLAEVCGYIILGEYQNALRKIDHHYRHASCDPTLTSFLRNPMFQRPAHEFGSYNGLMLVFPPIGEFFQEGFYENRLKVISRRFMARRLIKSVLSFGSLCEMKESVLEEWINRFTNWSQVEMHCSMLLDLDVFNNTDVTTHLIYPLSNCLGEYSMYQFLKEIISISAQLDRIEEESFMFDKI